MSKDKHTVQTGIHVGRVGVYVYAREYWQYHSYDRYVDIEAKILFVGIGIRFIWIKRKVKR